MNSYRPCPAGRSPWPSMILMCPAPKNLLMPSGTALYLTLYRSIASLRRRDCGYRNVLSRYPRSVVADVHEFAKCHDEQQGASGCQGIFPQIFPKDGQKASLGQ